MTFMLTDALVEVYTRSEQLNLDASSGGEVTAGTRYLLKTANFSYGG